MIEVEDMCSVKRSLDCVDDADRHFKSPRLFFRLESGTSESDGDGNESVYSLQMAETASAHDTSDTTDRSEEEYSLESLSEVEAPDVSSGSDEICIVGDFNEIASVMGSDISVVADLSDSRSTSGDSEIGPADYWKCVMCNTINTNPCFPKCEKCFRIRKSICPPRPKSKKKKNKKSKSMTSSSGSACEGPSSLETHDSGLGLGSSQPSPECDEDLPGDQICTSCFLRPANGVFVHQRSGHQVFCYKCSQRISLERKKCPYCNGAILRVIQVYKVNC